MKYFSSLVFHFATGICMKVNYLDFLNDLKISFIIIKSKMTTIKIPPDKLPKLNKTLKLFMVIQMHLAFWWFHIVYNVHWRHKDAPEAILGITLMTTPLWHQAIYTRLLEIITLTSFLYDPSQFRNQKNCDQSQIIIWSIKEFFVRALWVSIGLILVVLSILKAFVIWIIQRWDHSVT